MILGRSVQCGIFLAALLLMALVNLAFAPDLFTQILILAPAVALLGLPHGAFDLPMAQVLWPLRGSADRARFFVAYLGIAAAVAGLWWTAPGLGLSAFLAYSALHFSTDWEIDGALLRAAGGLSVIGAPAVFSFADVASIFFVLTDGAFAAPIARALAIAGLLGGALVLIVLLREPARRKRALVELAGIWIGAAILPPLLYFVAYFCLLHSLRHMTETLDALPDRKTALLGAAGIMATSLVGATLAFTILLFGDGFDIEASVLRLVFIGLAALTVPHMLLVERFRRETTDM